jgi:hypothetical protein
VRCAPANRRLVKSREPPKKAITTEPKALNHIRTLMDAHGRTNVGGRSPGFWAFRRVGAKRFHSVRWDVPVQTCRNCSSDEVAPEFLPRAARRSFADSRSLPRVRVGLRIRVAGLLRPLVERCGKRAVVAPSERCRMLRSPRLTESRWVYTRTNATESALRWSCEWKRDGMQA